MMDRKANYAIPPQFGTPQEYLSDLVSTVNSLEKWIYDIHPFDLYTEEGKAFLEESFLPEWKEWLSKTSLETLLDNLAAIMLGDEDILRNVAPPSLQDIILKAASLKLPNPHESSSSLKGRVHDKGKDKASAKDCTRAGMSGKKLHEVNRLTDLLFRLAEEYQITTMVDFGSGLGYLGHELAKRIPVIAIECDALRTSAALNRSEKLAQRQKREPTDNITYISQFLNADNVVQAFEDAISSRGRTSAGSEVEEITEGMDKLVKSTPVKEIYILTGLHACGDLSGTTMPDLFRSNPDIKCLVSVGCCYHLMDTSFFPKSKLLQSLNFKVDKRALKMACHTFVAFDGERVKGVWRSQVMRAVTQVKGKLGMKDDQSLVENLAMIRGKNGLPERGETEEELEAILKNIALLSTIRCHIGPLIEAAVLLDRVESLREQDPELARTTTLQALFDPAISPRNHVVVSIK